MSSFGKFGRFDGERGWEMFVIVDWWWIGS